MDAETAFWDASGVALLCMNQRASAEARRIVPRWPRMVLWWGTPVEVRSAFMRQLREGAMQKADVTLALKRLARIWNSAGEIVPTEEVRMLAETMLDTYALRAGDAFQLAAALVACGEIPRDRPFVCFDRGLSLAAEKAGFTVVPQVVR